METIQIQVRRDFNTPPGALPLRISTAIGTIGMLLIVSGTLIDFSFEQKMLFFVGTVFMGVPAVVERQPLFMALELVLLVGSAIAFAPFETLLKALCPLLVAVGVCAYLYRTGALSTTLNRIGAAGLITLALGYAISHPAVYLIGGVLITIYSVRTYLDGVRIAILWAILNAIFSCTSVWALWRHITL